MLEGLFIGVGGAALGLLAGLVLSVNVNEVFALVESSVNGVLGIGRDLLLALAPRVHAARFAIFSRRASI